jgi:small subunit ribosomal protein S20
MKEEPRVAETQAQKKKSGSEKRIIQSRRRHEKNVAVKSEVKTVFKKALETIHEGVAEAAATHVKNAVITIDKAASKGIVHKNKAARKKSRLAKKLNAMAVLI